jgi:hypothetical protein
MSAKIPKNLPLPVYEKGGTKETWMAHLRACRDVHRHNRKLAAQRKAAREAAKLDALLKKKNSGEL